MQDNMQRALNGWLSMSEHGKLMALFLVIILFVWLYGKESKNRMLLHYSSFMGFCCILPVTAACLMYLQTRFYDYVWIWSYVPVTAFMAYGMVLYLLDFYPEYSSKNINGKWILLLIPALLLFFTSGFGKLPEGLVWKNDPALKNTETLICRIREKAERVGFHEQETPFCLLAPAEVLEHVREADSDITLVYGRNMWNESLNAYTYDVYSDSVRELYLWMEGEDIQPTFYDNWAQAAVGAGANCVLLPAEMARPEEIHFHEEGMVSCEIGDYIVYYRVEQ